MNKYDEKTQETAELIIFTVSLAMAVEKATADGWQWTDVVQLLPPMTKLPAALDGIEKVPDEIRAMDDEQRLELSLELKKLGFEDASAEAIGEQALRMAIEMARLIFLIRDERLKKEAKR